jgi:DNA-binding GntR family transcriptional regulator
MVERANFKLPALPDLVSEALRDEINQGILKPGDPVRMRDIADRLGVSAMPVREALRRLEAEGLVTFEKNRRITVAQLSADEISEVSEIRMELEALAIRHALPLLRADPVAMARLDDLLKKMDDENDPDVWRTVNESFHRALYAGADMPRLEALVNSMMASIEPYIRIYVRTHEHLVHAQAEHHAIVEHIRSGDVAAAEAVIRAHISYSRDRLYARLNGDTQPNEAGTAS